MRPLRVVSREVEAADPLLWFASARGERFYWERPDRGVALATQGVADVLTAEGPDRLLALDAAVARRFAALEIESDAPTPAGPRLVGGFGFGPRPPQGAWRDFPSSRLVLPERALVRRGERCFLTTCVARGDAADETPSGPGSGRPPRAERITRVSASAEEPAPHFLARVDEALRVIARGDLEKVVLARSLRIAADRPLDVIGLLASLRVVHPTCAIFAVAYGSSVFVGATPERLVSVAGAGLETAALAGSAPRGRNPEEDAEHARALVESKKEQGEHAVVVRALRGALAPYCRRLEVPEAPRLLRLGGIQHLETPVRGELRLELCRPGGILRLAHALHPSPAVGGAPREVAGEWLRRREPLERGWYAGGIGHLGPADGELDVALRCALIRGNEALCFAGAGVVRGSEPEAELREIRLKLRALLDPLTEL